MLKNYRFQTSFEEIENHLFKYCTPDDIYHDLVLPGFSYVHFYNKTIGDKVYQNLKSHTSQYQECYEKQYNIDEINKVENLFDKIYAYIKNEEYYELVVSDNKDISTHNEKKQKELVDEEGFTIIPIKKK